MDELLSLQSVEGEISVGLGNKSNKSNSGIWKMNWCSNVDAVLICSGKEKAENQGRTVDLQAHLRSYSLT